jgi:hypothetical protein
VVVTLPVTVRQVRDDGTGAPADGELAAALSGPAEQFARLLTWAADESGFPDHEEQEDVTDQEGRELQRRLLQATFALDSAREERIAHVTSAAGIPHGSAEARQSRGLASVFGPVRITRMAYRSQPTVPLAHWCVQHATLHLRRGMPPGSGHRRAAPLPYRA